jgi:hypothetical protein
VQEELRGDGENVPAAQGLQVRLPGGEKEPAGQSTQTAIVVAPLWDDAVPAGHLVQKDVFGRLPYVPAVQLVHCALPRLELVPAGHAAQTFEFVWRTPGEAVPAGQRTQLDALTVGPYDPAGQSRQLWLPAREYVPLGHP